MSYTITTGTRPNMRIITLAGNLSQEAMRLDPNVAFADMTGEIYLLGDASQLNLGLPDGFLDSVRDENYLLRDKRIVHAAIFVQSDALRVVGSMVARLTGQREKFSIHSSYAEALAHLEAMIDAEK